MTILQCTLRSTSRRLHCCRFYTSHALAWAHVHSQDTKPPRNATPRRNPLGPNKVDLYLASLRAAGLEPTSDDIERCRPSKHSHPSSPQYAEDYKTLVDRLCRSFSKEQLHKFAVQYGLTSTQSTRKVRLAEAIIEVQWNWPSLKAIEKHRRDTTEVSTKCALCLCTTA
jgi:hypothetical protein